MDVGGCSVFPLKLVTELELTSPISASLILIQYSGKFYDHAEMFYTLLPSTYFIQI